MEEDNKDAAYSGKADDARRVLQDLVRAQLSIPPLPQGEGMVRMTERDEAVRGVAETLEALGRGGDWESLAAAAHIIDRVLAAAAVPSKYLHCLAASSVGLALKLSEEAEWIPEAGLLSAASGGRLSSREIVRMERAVLERLDWDLRGPSLDRFLHLFASAAGLGPLLSLYCPREGRWGLPRLVKAAVTDSTLARTERASDLALALLSLHLEAAAIPHWLSITSSLQKSVGGRAEDVIRCREAVAGRLLKRKLHRSPEYGTPESSSPRSPRKRLRRKTLPSSFPRTKTPVERMCIDDLADSLLSRLFAPNSFKPMEVC